ncbi:hypothetical protein YASMINEVIRUS_576 [Yasminevirus sp. GU-2018]|uniref:Uncharacterized protein n=1 Tax=Yasminevirus sp. GU-2018 TaxID=2420051 RepID=A0A5K0U9M9_9VIRU|nr:hypothetical protein YASMINEVIRUS_576 [Yasminevirus sp. GU-2018]
MSVDYKYKPDKHKFRVNLKTIDEIHKEQLDDFKKRREAVPEKRRRLKVLEKELADLEASLGGKPIGLDFETLKKRNSLRSSIKTLKDDIGKTENYSAELEYYSRTGDVLEDYYKVTNGALYGQNFDGGNVDDESDEEDEPAKKSKIVISDELLAITNHNRKRKMKKPVRKRNKKIDMTPTKNIMDYLLGGDEKQEEESTSTCRASLQNQYLMMMDKEYACSKAKNQLTKKCKKCNVDKIIVFNESIVSCPKCGESDDIFIESDMPSQRETFAEKPKYPYKKLGHCIEKLNQFLCKGTANVPPNVFTVLEEEIEKHSLLKTEVTIRFIEAMMKKHHLSDYYENIMFIYSKITGKRPQTISRDEYELVLKMFVEAEEVYEKKYKPPNRNNFLKYTFVLNKIFLTIKRPEVAEHFKLLKSPDKLKQQERVWQKICADLGWDYCSS